jgi:hypothetical protein
MRRFAGRAVAALAFVVVLAMIPAVVVPAGGHPGPYVSALADLAGVAAIAGPQCPNKGCISPTRCGHVTGAFGCTLANGTCDSGRCR